MGTDVYMSYDGMTKEEEKKQVCGWSINNGENGYLRASIGMTDENIFLSGLFPHEIWESGGDEEDFDFMSEKNMNNLELLARVYLVAKIVGKPLPNELLGEKQKALNKMSEAITERLEGSGYTMMAEQLASLREAVMWLNSVYEFYALGYQKQKEKKNPKVMISW